MLNTLITPATVAIGIPLYKTLHLLKHHARSILVGIVTGCLISGAMMMFFGNLFQLPKAVVISTAPKNVTTAIAIEISKGFGGLSAITLVMVIFSGVSGSIMSPFILKLFKITDPVAQGIALGSSAHAIGTAKAMEMGEIPGAMSGLSIGVTGTITVIVFPLLLKLFHLQ